MDKDSFIMDKYGSDRSDNSSDRQSAYVYISEEARFGLSEQEGESSASLDSSVMFGSLESTSGTCFESQSSGLTLDDRRITRSQNVPLFGWAQEQLRDRALRSRKTSGSEKKLLLCSTSPLMIFERSPNRPTGYADNLSRHVSSKESPWQGLS